METLVNECKQRFISSGLQNACLDAYKTKLKMLTALGFNFADDNPRILIETNSKEEQLLQRLSEFPYARGFYLSNLFNTLMEVNGIQDLVLDDNNNIILPSGSAIRLSVFTKYCRDTCGTPYFDWQEINSFNIGSGLYLTIHPVDFANCSNHEDGITSWTSCFSPNGDYAASPYAYINSPYTMMVMKGKPDRMQGRMWLHLLTDQCSGKIAGYCLMRSYGACFTEAEKGRLQSTMSTMLGLKLKETDDCRIVTNNEISAEQSFELSSSDEDYHVYFDPIKSVYLADTFVNLEDKEFSLQIDNPFDKYGDDIYNCREFFEQDEANNNYSLCYHCDESFDYENNEGRYLDNYNRHVCNCCLDDFYIPVNDEYIWHENVVKVYRLNPETDCVECYNAEDSESGIEYDPSLGEYVSTNCLHTCEECEESHADYKIYQFLGIDYPCDEIEEIEQPQIPKFDHELEPESIRPGQDECNQQYYNATPTNQVKDA